MFCCFNYNLPWRKEQKDAQTVRSTASEKKMIGEKARDNSTVEREGISKGKQTTTMIYFKHFFDEFSVILLNV